MALKPARSASARLLLRAVDAGKRRFFEWRLHSLIDVESYPDLQRLGSEWGGWMVPAREIDQTWVCYCVGAGGDISFDLALLDRGATVRGVDPFHIFRDHALEQVGDNPRFKFLLYAVAPADGPVVMYGRQDLVKGGVSAANIYRTTERFEIPGRTVESLMAEAGDQRVDLLKLDIEGSEYEVLEALSPADLGVRVLCLEFHHTSSATRASKVLRRLSRDYAVVHRSSRSDVTLVRRTS